MKKKIGELYDKPIVIGNKNEVEKHEIHIDELNSGGAVGGDNWEYYLFDGALVEAAEGYTLQDFNNAIPYFFGMCGHTGIAASNGKCYPLYYTNAYYTSGMKPSNIMGIKYQGEPLTNSVLGVLNLQEYIALVLAELIGTGSFYDAVYTALTPCTKEEFEALITQE